MTRHLDAVPLACAGTKIGMAVASPRSESSLLALAGVMAAVGSVSLLDRLAILAKSPNLSVSQAESHFAPLVLVLFGLTLPIAPARPSKWSRLMTSGSGEKIHAVMVDDEDLTRQILRKLLSSHPEIEIVAEFADGFEAVKAVIELNPDLLFLDIPDAKVERLRGSGN